MAALTAAAAAARAEQAGRLAASWMTLALFDDACAQSIALVVESLLREAKARVIARSEDGRVLLGLPLDGKRGAAARALADVLLGDDRRPAGCE